MTLVIEDDNGTSHDVVVLDEVDLSDSAQCADLVRDIRRIKRDLLMAKNRELNNNG